MRKKLLLNSWVFALLMNLPGVAMAHKDSTGFHFSGYADVYYSNDGPANGTIQRPAFTYNYRNTNAVAINLAMAKLSYTNTTVRGNLGLMYGNYPQYNLAAEDASVRPLYEANIGVRLRQKNNVWVDAGVMPSHIGFESAIGIDNWMASRSLVADNSPYYEAGVKISGNSANEKFKWAGLYLNGWQTIEYRAPSVGLQVSYQLTPHLLVNYSNYASLLNGSNIFNRYYHNFYALYQKKSWGIIVGFDYGQDVYRIPQRVVAPWFTPVVIIRKQLTDNWAVAARAEYFKDRSGILGFSIPNSKYDIINWNKLDVLGFSTTIDYKVSNLVTWRNEVKLFHSEYMGWGKFPTSTNTNLLTVLCFRLP